MALRSGDGGAHLNPAPRVVVVGAGVGGLAAARGLAVLAARLDRPLELVVLDAAARVGGAVGTESLDGVLVERGADTLVTHKPAAVELCRRLGLGGRLVFPGPTRARILAGDRLLPVPAGFALLAPGRRWPLLTSPLLGWRGRLRALAEPFARRAPSPDGADESVAAFVRRRFGSELLERVVEPIVGAIHLGDVERLSLAAIFPRFAALERERGRLSGSLPAAKPGQPPLAALAGGLGELVAALAAALPAGALRLGARVEGVTRAENGFALRLAGGETLAAAAVLLAVPSHAAAPLVHELDAELAGRLGAIGWASCASVHLVWPLVAVGRPPDAHGFFVPRAAGGEVVAVGFPGVKFPERAPADRFVARLFLGGALRPGAVDLPDAELVERSVRFLAPRLGIREPPTAVRVDRHALALPQPAVGHPEHVARLRERLALHPGLELAGGATGVYGLPDTVAAGESAASRLFQWIDLTADDPPRAPV